MQTPRSNSNHFFQRSGSEYRSLLSNRSVVRASSRDRKLEPKSTWEPNEQGQHCKACQGKIGILKRKHHCRKCGQ